MHKYMLGFHFVYSCQRCNSFIHKSSVPPPQPRFFCDACSSGTTLLTYSATKSKCPFELHIWSIEYDGHRHFSLSSNGSGSWLLATSTTGIARNSTDMSFCNFLSSSLLQSIIATNNKHKCHTDWFFTSHDNNDDSILMLVREQETNQMQFLIVQDASL